jgi:hypothetical protein
LASNPKKAENFMQTPLTSFSREVDTSRGSSQKRKLIFFGPNQKLLPLPLDFKKIIALAFIEYTSPYSQIPY